MAQQEFSIGEVAERSGIPVSTVRYYERRGLIDAPQRDPSSNYRRYEPEIVRRIRFIRRAQDVGFTLSEIEQLLTFRADCETSCSRVEAFALAKIDEIERQIDELTRMRDGLRELASICPGDASSACPILDVLEPDDGAEAS